MKKIEASQDYLLPASLHGMHSKSAEWFSLVQFWKVELSIFEKLLRLKSVNTTSEYSNPAFEELQAGLIDLKTEVGNAWQRVKDFKHRMGNYDMKHTIVSETKCGETYGEIKKQIKSLSTSFTLFKGRLYEFLERKKVK